MKQLNEHQEQALLIRWFRLQYPALHLNLFAIPNGGARHIVTAVRLKEEGVVAGIPDLFLMLPKSDWHGLFIEMKAKTGKVSKAQKDFIALANSYNYKAVVCYGFEDAKNMIEKYLHSSMN